MTARFAASGPIEDLEFAVYAGPGAPPTILAIVDGVAAKSSDHLTAANIQQLRAQLAAQGEVQSFTQPKIPGASLAVEAVIAGESPDGDEAAIHILVAQHGDRTFTMTYLQFGSATAAPDWMTLVAGVRLSEGSGPWMWILGGGALVLLLIVIGVRRSRASAMPVTSSSGGPFGSPHAASGAPARPSWAAALPPAPGPGPAPHPALAAQPMRLAPSPSSFGASPPAAPPGLRSTLRPTTTDAERS